MASDTRAKARVNFSPRLSAALQSDRGDIIAIHPGDFDGWGTRECGNYPPSEGGIFACIRVTDISVSFAREYDMPVMDEKDEMTAADRFYVDIPALPFAMRNTLLADGEYEMTWSELRPYVFDSVTGEYVR